MPLGWGAGWVVTRQMGVGQLSKADEPKSKMTKLIGGTFGGTFVMTNINLLI